MLELVKNVFKVSSKTDIIYPPDQVFTNPKFEFLFTIGGHLADGANEYEKLISLLNQIGEKEFFIVENSLNKSSLDKSLAATIPIENTFQQFDEVVKSFDPPTGFYINDFFVFGHNDKWGIYICECPTINIIGCSPDLKLRFKEVYNINSNGYKELESFIEREYNYRSDLKTALIKNYKID